MKTTIELDEKKVGRLLKLTGLKTRRAVVDWALSEAERAARMKKLFAHPLAPAEFVDAVDPRYDLLTVRGKDRPFCADYH